MKSEPWFKNPDCVELNIIKYKSISNSTAVAAVAIKDKAVVQEFMQRINSLPANGDEMIDMGPKAARTTLSFSCANNSVQMIEFLNKKIKTPSTGFLSAKNSDEENLYRDIDAIVQPDFNKRLPKIKDLRIQFKDFTVAFTGEKNTPQPEGGPTVGPTNNVFYSVWQKASANEISFNIFDGQIPPQPQAFVVGKKIYYILTYQNGKGESLYPKYFEISEKVSRNR